MSSCMCGDDDCPRCYPSNYYDDRREYDDATGDYRTDRLMDELDNLTETEGKHD
jgi:hypothetical protein